MCTLNIGTHCYSFSPYHQYQSNCIPAGLKLDARAGIHISSLVLHSHSRLCTGKAAGAPSARVHRGLIFGIRLVPTVDYTTVNRGFEPLWFLIGARILQHPLAQNGRKLAARRKEGHSKILLGGHSAANNLCWLISGACMSTGTLAQDWMEKAVVSLESNQSS